MIRLWSMALSFALAAAPAMAPLAGVYDGSQMEIGAGLELKPDGRFHYALAYGALDEQAEGGWTVDDGAVLLSSDPVVPPRFVLVGQEAGSASALSIEIDVPTGLSPQYFKILVHYANGPGEPRQLNEDGLSLPFDANNPALAAQLFFAVYGVASDLVALDLTKGHALRFRFDANDLGKVDFRAQRLKLDDGALLLQRHDRLIRFRRVNAP